MFISVGTSRVVGVGIPTRRTLATERRTQIIETAEL